MDDEMIDLVAVETVLSDNPRLMTALSLHLEDWMSLSINDRQHAGAHAAAKMLATGYFVVDEKIATNGELVVLGDGLLDQLHEMSGVARLLGVEQRTVSKYQLPQHDVSVGAKRGWRASTIRRWDALRKIKPTPAVRRAAAAADEIDQRRIEMNEPELPIAEWLYVFDQELARTRP